MENLKKSKIPLDRKKFLNNLRSFEKMKPNDYLNSSNSSRISPRASPDASFQNNHYDTVALQLLKSQNKESKNNCSQGRGICENCLPLFQRYTQQQGQKKEIVLTLTEHNKNLELENAVMKRKMQNLSDELASMCQNSNTYKNNLTLMEHSLNTIKLYLKNQQNAFSLEQEENSMTTGLRRGDENIKEMEFQFLKKVHSKNKKQTECKIQILNQNISSKEKEIKDLKEIIGGLNNKIEMLEELVNNSAHAIQQREMLRIAGEELVSLKTYNSNILLEKQLLKKNILKLKNKIKMLTSLIGYGVVSNVNNSQLHQIQWFKESLEKVGAEEKLNIQPNSKEGQSTNLLLNSLSQQNMGSSQRLVNLFNFIQENQLKNVLEENRTLIIKADFFMLMRSILDSKYLEFLTQRQKATNFLDFFYSFLRVFKVRSKQKRIQIQRKIQFQDLEMAKKMFILKLMDRKLGQLPEIMTIKEFVLYSSPKDEIFYFLMCRNFIHNGPEMANYISCGDSYNFVPYQRVRRCLVFLLFNYQNTSKTLILNHLNQKKVLKNKNLLIKSGYVLKVLLEGYRRLRAEKIQKLKDVFTQTLKLLKKQTLPFNLFTQMMRKNFDFLTHQQITQFFRNTIDHVSQNKSSSFFQAFNVTCMDQIFLKQNLANDAQIRKKFCEKRQKTSDNHLIKLIPTSVSHLGNEILYHKYLNMIKQKNLSAHELIDVGQILLKIAKCRIWSTDQKQDELPKLEEILDTFINNLIDWINRNFQIRQKYEKSLESASSRLGWHLKKKVYEFYSDFIEDINKEMKQTTHQ